MRRYLKSALAFLAILPVAYACVDEGRLIGPDLLRSVPISLIPQYNTVTSESDPAAARVLASGRATLTINRIRLIGRDVATGDTLGLMEQDVDPTADSWTLSLDVDVPDGEEVEVVVTIALIHVLEGGSETVEWSGKTEPLTVEVGQTEQSATIQIYRGPTSNLEVAALTIRDSLEWLMEQDSADVSVDLDYSGSDGEPPEVFWTVIESSRAEVEATGAAEARLRALVPGDVRLVAEAGPRRDTLAMRVVARPVTLALEHAGQTVDAGDTIRVSSLQDTVTIEPDMTDARGASISDAPFVTWAAADTAVLRALGDGRYVSLANGASNVSADAVGLAAGTVVLVDQVVASAAIDPASDTIAVNNSLRLRGIARDSNGVQVAGVRFAWSSSDTAVAVVDTMGVVTARDTGWVDVTGTAETSHAASARLRVTPGQPAKIGTVGKGARQDGLAGQTLPDSLVVRITDANDAPVNGVTVRWSTTGGSLSTTVTNTDDRGLARVAWTLPAEVGTDTVTAAVEVNLSLQAKFVATVLSNEASTVVITPDSLRFTSLEGSASLEAAAFNDKNYYLEGAAFTWTSSHPDIVQVDTAGNVMPVGYGATTVIATTEGASGSIPVVVVRVPASLSIVSSDTAMAVGDTATFAAAVYDSAGSAFQQPAVAWESQNTAVLTVDETGQVTAQDTGTTSVVARFDSAGVTVADTVAVTVTEPVAVAAGMSTLAAGQNFTCGLDPNTGQAHCWGSNSNGRLGDGTTVSRFLPGAVAGGYGLLSVTTGNGHACGLDADGSAYCWGAGFFGQLGDGLATSDSLPRAVASGGVGYVQVSAGGSHACALDTDGRAWCWGANGVGQVGDSTTASTVGEPSAVAGGHTFAAIATGEDHTCALDVEGRAWCWGYNSDGQLGDATVTNRSYPVQVADGHTFVAIAVGGNVSCALDADGQAWCWGYNFSGQLGINLTGSGSAVPAMVSQGQSVFAAIDVGQDHTCALDAGGFAWCWGDNNLKQLGTTTDWCGSDEGDCSPVPVQVSTSTTFEDVTAGTHHSCAVTASGTIHCWGSNESGELGNGEGSYTATPIGQGSGLQATAMAADRFGCAVSGGSAYCWGNNDFGQLGDGTMTDQPSPVQVSGLSAVDSVDVGFYHACALSQGTLYCWGGNGNGQLGDGTQTNSPTPLAVAGHSFVDFAVGAYHTCGIDSIGEAYCWGYNIYGQVGDSTSNNNRLSPVRVAADSGTVFTEIVAGDHHTCAVADTGSAYCWGMNATGQLGNGDQALSNQSAPVLVNSYTFKGLTAGAQHTCGLDQFDPGIAYCWGSNEGGRLGDGGFSDQYSPAIVSGVSDIQQISAGFGHTCAVDGSGAVWCWGNNDSGELGRGTVTSFEGTPAAVESAEVFGSVTTGASFTCAARTDGSLYCWGTNANGSLGAGWASVRTAPVAVEFSGAALTRRSER